MTRNWWVPEQYPEPARSEPAGEDLFLRPFVLTGGRTRPQHDGLRIESLLLTDPAARTASLRFEARRIVELCHTARSIADLAVALRVPLGVIRVLVADLLSEGHLRVGDQPGELPLALIERIRDRVRAL
ncbi:MAG TPA: DUF742 domain-containing protein [Actinoplanes sp.]|jgi:hypothetical protein